MSEYQYHEFVALDRALTARQQADLRDLWPDADVTDTGLTCTYHGGDVAGDPRALVEGYFDAFLYSASWGTRRLLLRVPRRLLDLGTARRYCYAASAIASGDDRHVFLDLVSDDMGELGEPGELPKSAGAGDLGYTGAPWHATDTTGTGGAGDVGGSADAEAAGEAGQPMPSILPVREELASGDLRMLYLAWLLSVQSMEIEDDAVEPPVPPNLRTLSPSLRSLGAFLRIDDALMTVAARASLEPEPEIVPGTEMAPWIEGIPTVVKDAWLLRIARDDDPHVRGEMLRRYRTDSGVITAAAAGERTAVELIDSAATLREERARIADEERAREQARQEQERALARERELEAVAEQQEYAWKRVGMLIDTRKPNDYDQAVALLVDLKKVSLRCGSPEVFDKRFAHLHQRHQKKPNLIERFKRAGLLEDG